MSLLPEPDIQHIGWNAGAGRYVNLDTGRFIAKASILGALEARIQVGQERVADLLAGVLQTGAGFTEFQQAFLLELKYAHMASAALGAGGWDQMTAQDWGRVGGILRREYGYARQLFEDIRTGRISEGQVEARMRQYEAKIWNQYWESDRDVHVQTGRTEERRVLQPAEHCPDCIDLAGRGWQPINTLPTPGDGSTQCGSNDKCIMEFR